MKPAISALMDDGAEASQHQVALRALEGNPEAQEIWARYHLIRDAMQDMASLSEGFCARVSARIAAEPTVLAPQASHLKATQPKWIGKTMLAASVVAAGFVAWSILAPFVDWNRAVTSVAHAPADLEASAVAVPMTSAVNEYLMAHHAYAARGGLQGVAPYVRTVSTNTESRR